MTTGRINQVTIVRRGWPTAHISGQKSYLVTGIAITGTAAASSTTGRTGRVARRHPPPPSSFPRALSVYTPFHNKLRKVYHLGTPRGDHGREIQQMQLDQSQGISRSIFSRCSNLPLTHRAQHSALRGPRPQYHQG